MESNVVALTVATIEGHTEDVVAMDYAAGIPTQAILARHNLASGQTLARILEKPRVARQVQGYQASIHDAAVRAHTRKIIAMDSVLDVLIARAQDPDDPKQDRIGMWVVDGVAPPTSRLEVEAATRMPVEAIGQFADAVAQLGAMVASRREAPGLLREGDVHLHQGKDFIAQRDQSLAGLPDQ